VTPIVRLFEEIAKIGRQAFAVSTATSPILASIAIDALLIRAKSKDFSPVIYFTNARDV
jgi:hypothetical protein